MNSFSTPEIVYIATAFSFQVILICHFALRKRHYEMAIRWGKIVYAAGIPAALICVYLLSSGMSWYFWLGGILYLVWASYGYYVEYIRQIEWRSPVRWAVPWPYINLYLATVMFYWWPLALLYKPLWYFQTILFLVSTFMNVISHQHTGNLMVKESVS